MAVKKKKAGSSNMVSRDKKKSFFPFKELQEEIPRLLLETAASESGFSSANEAEAILCSSTMAKGNNYAICTDSVLAYITTGLHTLNVIPLSYITGATLLSPKIHQLFICVTVGGAQNITLEIYAEKADTIAFFDFLREKTEKAQCAICSAHMAHSSADEIKKFKDLLAMGAITEDEYTAKKKQLLES